VVAVVVNAMEGDMKKDDSSSSWQIVKSLYKEGWTD
jgi:hypothetical protein